jgi:hypothetical protein
MGDLLDFFLELRELFELILVVLETRVLLGEIGDGILHVVHP